MQQRDLRIGILGCGPIAQNAHLDAVRKARNAELYAICDAAPDLLERMRQIHAPRYAHSDYAAMLADPELDAVVIAVDDRYHAELAGQALAAGKHLLVEKPLAVSVEECEELRAQTAAAGLVVQVGNNRRFHPGWQDAKRFLDEEMGGVLAFSAWYHDSVHRYTLQDNLYPVPVVSDRARRPAEPWKEVRERYCLLTHASHLLDTARYFLGPITSVRAVHLEGGDQHSWTIEARFCNGVAGQLRLVVPAQADFEEGFQIYGEHGSIEGSAPLPWFQRARVECFKDGHYQRVLGEDGFTFKRQVEAFADTVLNGAPQQGATVEDGLATVRGLVAVSHAVVSGETVRLDEVTGPVVVPEKNRTAPAVPRRRRPVPVADCRSIDESSIGIFAKTFPRPSLEENATAVRNAGFSLVHFNMACAGLPSMPDEITAKTARTVRDTLNRHGIRMAGISATFNLIHPDPAQRRVGLRRLQVIASHAKAMGTSLVTLCTGTRDADDMWRGHGDNTTAEAWQDMRAGMEQAVAIAEQEGVFLGIEPEVANVVDSARAARTLLDELRTDRVKIICDPANILRPVDARDMRPKLEEFFDLLGDDIAMGHAKDVVFDGEQVTHCPAGTGSLDYATYLELFAQLAEPTPLIIHGLAEHEVSAARAHVQSRAARIRGSRDAYVRLVSAPAART
ncbi:TIM barrel protein [Streptomyces sp. TRM66268-LWL]|uniref:TIM barrel protein n=1 Tax=Streptomyces polyasparticus TaxID=2767826 RepID=A0ABR7SWW9_9ACTN|nr:TIM barrel protein [Streptomyces polyasparticus]MBC9719447.1 TIM barrel protein [Streptomyces polyasparticus]